MKDLQTTKNLKRLDSLICLYGPCQIKPFRSKEEENQKPGSTNSRALSRREATPKGIRIPVTSVKGRCPRPLDDGGNETNAWKAGKKGGIEVLA
jgi:hypothetical protein